MASKSQVSGMRGVFLVAAELAERGLVVSPTSRSAQGVDLLVTNQNGSKTFAVEVKSTAKNSFWMVGKDAGKHPSRNNIWVFVKFAVVGERSRYFVVPSKHLRKYVRPGRMKSYVKREDLLRYEEYWSAFSE